MKKRYWILALLLLAAGTVIGRTWFAPDPPEPTYLPSEAVTVEVVPQSMLDELVASSALSDSLSIENGELRDELGRKIQVIQRLTVDTGPVESPEPEIITRIIREACEEEAPPIGRAGIEAFLFSGLDEDGDLKYGWTGNIRCWIAAPYERPESPDWGLLVERPFRLSNTQAITSAAPEQPRAAKRWYAGTHVALFTQSEDFTFRFDYETRSVSFDPTSLRAYGGRRWFPLKKWSIRTGVFADSDSLGVDLGIDF